MDSSEHNARNVGLLAACQAMLFTNNSTLIANPASPLIAIRVELLVNSIAWQAASRPTLRASWPLLFICTVSG